LLYARRPTAEETTLGVAFLANSTPEMKASNWESYAQVLLSAHEFGQLQ
jgi:hypothetical protein